VKGFALRKTVVPMDFPLARKVRYRYFSGFLEPRVGQVRWYNHARGKTSDGTLLRAHDGVDIYAAMRTPLLAVVSGTIVDPATVWKPWNPARYGLTVVIQSDEPTGLGYRALYAHLDSVAVKIGQHVERGDVLGRLGITGNARRTNPHVHFELRAPFLIPVREAGSTRRLDAFDPYPSLVRADPKR